MNGGVLPVVPNLDEVIASAGNESPLLTRSGICAYETTWRSCWCPAHGVDAHAMSMEHLMSPAVVPELQHADLAIR